MMTLTWSRLRRRLRTGNKLILADSQKTWSTRWWDGDSGKTIAKTEVTSLMAIQETSTKPTKSSLWLHQDLLPSLTKRAMRNHWTMKYWRRSSQLWSKTSIQNQWSLLMPRSNSSWRDPSSFKWKRSRVLWSGRWRDCTASWSDTTRRTALTCSSRTTVRVIAPTQPPSSSRITRLKSSSFRLMPTSMRCSRACVSM